MATTFEYPFNVGNGQDYGEVLKKLHSKMSNINKNISYLDVYNIVDVVSDKVDFAAKVGNLGVNSALIINTQPFWDNNINYNTGDIIYKMSNGTSVHIKAQAGGIYFPSEIKQEKGGLSIVYKYAPAAPTKSDETIPSGGKTDTAAETMTFENLTSSSNTNIYGLWQKYSDPFDVCSVDNENIQPEIQFWLTKEEDGKIIPIEEISLEYQLIKNGSKWQVELVESINANMHIFMKVK